MVINRRKFIAAASGLFVPAAMGQVYLPHRRKAWRGSGGANTLTYQTNLGIWCKAGTESYANNDPVGTFTDKTGNGRHWTASSAARPTFVTGNSNGGKTFSALSFDSTNQYMSTASLNMNTMLGATVASTVFLVIKPNSTGPNGEIINVNDATYNCWATYSDVIYFDCPNTGAGRISASQPAIWDDAWVVLELYRSGANGEIMVSGSSLVTGSSMTTAIPNSSYPITLGSGISGSNKWKGLIAEVLLYQEATSSGNRTTIRNYLKTEYGIS